MHKEINKVILISSYAPPSLGGPQNLYNLLRDVDPNYYCILTSFYNIDNVSARIGTWLKGEYIFYDNTSSTKNITNISDNSTFKKRALVNKLKKIIKYFTIIHKIMRFFATITQIIAIISKGIKVIKDKNINSIIGFSDNGPAMIGAYILHKITKKRYSIFLFDLYKGNLFPFPENLLANFFEPRMFRSANKIIVTNEGTRDFYIKRYGQNISKKIVIIHNSAFADAYLKIEKQPKLKNIYTIVYTGKIYWAQVGPIKNLIQAIHEIKDLKIKLKIYSPSPKNYLKEIGIIESEKVEILVTSPEEIPKIQNDADILFLPLSWGTNKQKAIIDTATPGKLTDYLIAGKPILIHAPASSYLVKYAKDNNFAEIVDEENIEKLKESIKKLILDPEYANGLVNNAQKTFYKSHNAMDNSIKLREILNG